LVDLQGKFAAAVGERRQLAALRPLQDQLTPVNVDAIALR